MNPDVDSRDLETKLRKDLGLLEWQIRDLLPILNAEVIKAQIAALNILHRAEGPGLPERDYDNGTDELIDWQIDELETQLALITAKPVKDFLPPPDKLKLKKPKI